jgi:3-hydroxybutyryl-CoA dehydrogenase
MSARPKLILGVLHLDDDIAKKLVTGVNAEAGQTTHAQLSKQRDAMIAAMQKATVDLRRK